MQEIIQKRNYNTKHFLLAPNQFLLKAHTEHIHYKDGNQFEEVDTRLEKEGDKWVQTKASYHLELSKYSTEPIVFNDRFNINRDIIFIPECNKVEGELVDENGKWIQKQVLYKNAFGNDIDLRCTAGPISFRKEIVINRNPGHNIQVRFKLVLPSERIVIEDQETKVNHLCSLTGKMIKIGDSDVPEEFTYIRKAIASDAKGQVMNIPLWFEVENGDLYIVKNIPANFLRDAAFPVISDTTTSYYALAGDGGVEYYGASTSWATVHNAAAGTAPRPTETYGDAMSYNSGTAFKISRLFLPIDTSSLNGVISAASLFIDISSRTLGDDDAQAYIAVVKTFQGATNTLTASDYEDCGYDTGNEVGGRARFTPIVKGSSDYAFSGFGTGWLEMVLNATGRGWIVKGGHTKIGIREGHDLENQSIAANVQNTIRIDTSETADDPYLSVTYEPALVLAPSDLFGNLAEKYLSGNLM